MFECSFLFPYVLMYLGFKVVPSSLKHMKAPRKVYVLVVKISPKIRDLDRSHFFQEKNIWISLLKTVFLEPYASMRSKTHMCTVMYHVSMCMFYVILCVQAGKGFRCIAFGLSGWGRKFSRSWARGQWVQKPLNPEGKLEK